MKKFIYLTFCFLMPFFASSQALTSVDGEIVSGAILDSLDLTTSEELLNEIDSIANVSGSFRQIIDTIDTSDKFTKIFLFSDHTWDYFDIGRPVINDSVIDYMWNTEVIHAYKEVSAKELPDEIDILLVDSLHSWASPFVGKVNSKYCFRGRRAHNGTDIKINIGDSIHAAFDGKVRVVMKSSMTGGYGQLIVIRHSNGLETYYGHLSKMFVKEDEIVKAGEVIGLGGNTGRSTGPHLHFEIRYLGQSFDPERLFDFENGSLRADTLFALKKHYFSIYSHYGQSDAQSIAASQRQFYTIKSGDTLSAIARKYGTTVSNLCRINNMKSNTTLRVGKRIVVRE